MESPADDNAEVWTNDALLRKGFVAMGNFLMIFVEGRHLFDIPIASHGGGVESNDNNHREFVADQPARSEELNVTEVRLYSEQLPKPVRFLLPSVTVLAGEAARWTVTGRKRTIIASLDFELEYYVRERFGEVVRHPTVLTWSTEKEEMEAN